MRWLALGAAGGLFLIWLIGTIIIKIDPRYGPQPQAAASTNAPISTLTATAVVVSTATRAPVATPMPLPTSTLAVTRTAAPSRPEIGKEAKVWADGLPEWHFATDQQSLDQWNAAVRANDTTRLNQLIRTGKSFALKDGTRVLVLDQDFFVTSVRVLEGPYAGKVGWVNYEHVR